MDAGGHKESAFLDWLEVMLAAICLAALYALLVIAFIAVPNVAP